MARGTALITGASAGLGAELAKLCAGGGYNVILIARGGARLAQLAASLTATCGIEARPLVADLSNPAAPPEIFAQVRATPIDILINNAGFGVRGAYVETDWAAESRLLQVNVAALAHLTKLFLPEMVRRRSGRILNVASTAAFVPGPFMAMYYASKAFVLSFSEALAEEVQGSGVTVTALIPGPTETNFAATAGTQDSRLFRTASVMSAAAVARVGFDGLMAGKRVAIAGASNRLTVFSTRLAPRTMLAKITRKLNS
jgi:hypothetical protein